MSHTNYTHISNALSNDPKRNRDTSPSFPRVTDKLNKASQRRDTGKLTRDEYRQELEKAAKSLPNLSILFHLGE
jgi:hypothetical protein